MAVAGPARVAPGLALLGWDKPACQAVSDQGRRVHNGRSSTQARLSTLFTGRGSRVFPGQPIPSASRAGRRGGQLQGRAKAAAEVSWSS